MAATAAVVASEPTSNGSSKPSVLIVGGLGYIGRFLALHIHSNNLASDVRLVDKQLPELAFLAPEFKEACARDKFVQADASREQAFPRVFDREDGSQFDYVFNCGGDTRYSQPDTVYQSRSYALSLALGRESARRKIRCFIELSTGMVYKSDRLPRKETDKTKPHLRLAKWKLQAEEDLAKIRGLNLVVLRLPNVYGPFTKNWLGTALCMARVYQHLGKEMKWLWDKELRTNTLHVDDAASALWTAAQWYTHNRPTGSSLSVFNVVDHGATSQNTLATMLRDYFGIATGFHGTLVSSFARLHLDSAVDDVNDELLDPWAGLQAAAGIQPGPVTPYMEKELLQDKDLSLDGSLFERTTGFAPKRERLGVAEVDEVVQSYRRMGWWP